MDWGKVAWHPVGAELANIVNEAALRPSDGRFAAQADLEESIEVVIAGCQKKNAIRQTRRRRWPTTRSATLGRGQADHLPCTEDHHRAPDLRRPSTMQVEEGTT